jgi:hypothetical protein
MPMEMVWERLTCLKNLIGSITEDGDHSINDKLEFTIEMAKKVDE